MLYDNTRHIVIRRSESSDRAALEQLAALESRRNLPEGVYLLAEARGELVAAASLDTDAEPMSDPFRPTAEIREWIGRQASALRRAA